MTWTTVLAMFRKDFEQASIGKLCFWTSQIRMTFLKLTAIGPLFFISKCNFIPSKKKNRKAYAHYQNRSYTFVSSGTIKGNDQVFSLYKITNSWTSISFYSRAQVH